MQNNQSILQPSRSRPSGRCSRLGSRIIVNKRAVLVMPRTGKPHPVLLQDLSIGGACVQTDAKLLMGDSVRLRIDTGMKTDLVLDGIVVGIRPRPERLYTEFGLRFIGVDAPVRAALEAYISLRGGK